MQSIRNHIIALVCLIGLHMQAQSVANLRINEVMSANIDQFVDPSWNYGGWIEIYNPTGKALNLDGLWLSDNPNDLRKVHITHDTPVPAHGFALLWFGHHYIMAPTQIDMKLDCDGGTVCLSDDAGKLIDQVDYPEAVARTSWMRTTNGGREWALAALPTPGKSNTGGAPAVTRLPAPQVSHESCIFASPVSFTVEIPEGATLRYTTDGSTPTPSHGLTSETGTFTAENTRVYRFALFGEGCLPSPVVTRSFIRRNKDFNIPVVSVVTNPDNLYSDQTGVFVKGTNGRRGKGNAQRCNWNMDWDRPVNIEIMDAAGRCLLNQEVELSRSGGHSKGSTPYSFRVKAGKKYEGLNYLPVQVFDDKSYLKHRGLLFRGGCNDSNNRIRDDALQTILRTSGMDIDLQDYQPVCHYINGVFMGTINMREPSNRLNVYANHGLDEDEIDFFEIDCDSCYVQKCGTKDAWNALLTLSASAANAESYERLRQMADIDEMCNYMAVELYLGNWDWPQNNCKGWRPVREDGKFRFVLFDIERAFELDDPFQTFASRRNYTFCELFDVPGLPDRSHYTRQVDLIPIFLNLLQNNDFRRHFLDAICLVAGSVYEPKRCEDIINDMVATVRPMQTLTSGYIGRNNDPTSAANTLISQLRHRPSLMHNVIQGYDALQANALRALPVRLKANVSQARLLVNGQQVPTNTFDGTLYQPVVVQAMAPEGYVFEGWKNGTTVVTTDESLKLTNAYKGKTLTACYRPPTPGPQARPVVVNEVSAGNSIYVNEYFKKNDWIELFNTTDAAIDLSGMYLSDDIKNPLLYRIPQADYSVVPGGGHRIVWCDGMEAKSQLHAPFRLANADSALVLLTAADQSWSDTLVYCAHEGWESVGRFPDGGTQLYRMSRPTIEQANAMNSYTILWDEPEIPTGIGQPEMASAQGGMSLRYSRETLYMKSEDETEATLAIYTIGGQLVMRQRMAMDDGRTQISVAFLAPGTYIVRLTDSQGNQCGTKFKR